MIILDATTKSLQVLLSGAVTTNQLPFVVSYADHAPATPAFTPGESDGTTNGTTAVTIAAAPASGVQRQVKQISIYNADTAQATVTVRVNNGGTFRVLMTATLQVGERIEYEECEGFSVFTSLGAKKVTAVTSVSMPDYISGMAMSWNSGTSITVGSGSAYIPASGAIVNVSSPITKAGLFLSANTWYHLYLYINAGLPDIEVVTTVPASPYAGMARAKTGDNSRRYVGSMRTDSVGNFHRIQHNSNVNSVFYITHIGGGSPFQVLSFGAATSTTAVSCATVIPVSGISSQTLAENNATSAFARIGNSTIGALAGSNYLLYMIPLAEVYFSMQLDLNQEFTYQMTAAPAAFTGLSVYVTGYVFAR